MSEIFDVAVIGGGPAGYYGAIRAAQLGGKVILFEKDTVGGTCLNRGCIPTKTFVKTGESIETFRKAAERGVVFSAPVTASVDMKNVVGYKNKVVKRLTGGVAELLRSNGVKSVSGEAVLVSADTIACGDSEYKAKNIILCGGSRPAIPNIPGIDSKYVVTSNEMLDAQSVPERLLIIGAGIIGCEFAIPFSIFGSQVTLVEASSQVMPGMDREVSEGIKKGMLNLGVRVLTSALVEKITETADGVVVTVNGEEIPADLVVAATGRTPVLDCLGPLKDSVEIENGGIVVDNSCRTSVPGLFACGDITSSGNLASEAFRMGEVAAECAMGNFSTFDLSRIPSCVHSEPEAACVGLNEDKARELYGEDLLIGKFPFGANGMCLASGNTDGFVKVLAEKNCGEIVGVHILGGNATELIAEACDLMAQEISIEEAAAIMHSHPSISEAFMEACADALGRCVHLPRKG